MTAQQIANEVKRTGIVWLGGEMEFPANQGVDVAFHLASQVAEACGYLVQWKYGQTAFSVVGGDIIGEVVLDWFDSTNPRLVKVEVWTPSAVYLDGHMEYA